MLRQNLMIIGAGLLSLAAAGCTPSASDSTHQGDDDTSGPTDEWADRLAARTVDYNAALRSASLKLVGDLPTLDEINQVASAPDDAAKKAAYEALIRQYLDDPRFFDQSLQYWRNTFKMGQSMELDYAPLFAAMLTTDNRSYMELFTATSGTCPAYVDDGTGTGNMVLMAQDCANNAPVTAGILTNPGVMKQYYSNLAFRRVRWVQEIFDCTAFPAEVTDPQDVGGAAKYTSPWDFNSIAGTDTGGRIDFKDVSAVICANCHSTLNHIAPLFAYFDDQGMWMGDEMQVKLPTEGNPRAQMSDYLPEGQQDTFWRLGVPAPDLAGLGQAMAADPAIAECAVARVWNFALGKEDIVSTLSVVPSSVITAQVAAFGTGGYKLKDMFFAVFTSDDFVKF